MGHSLIAGITGSGKSTLAKLIIKEILSRGHNVAILDTLALPVHWPQHKNVKFFRSADRFLEYARANKNLFLFVDEASKSLNKFDKRYNWLATQARHLGHVTYFIGQRVQQLSTDIRANCDRLYAFSLGGNDAKILVEEFNNETLHKVVDLKKGDFLVAARFKPTLYGSIDFRTMTVTISKDDHVNDTTNESAFHDDGQPATNRDGDDGDVK